MRLKIEFSVRENMLFHVFLHGSAEIRMLPYTVRLMAGVAAQSARCQLAESSGFDARSSITGFVNGRIDVHTCI